MLKEKIISSHILFQEKNNGTEFINTIRNKALAVFEQKGFPTRKDEEWKYTNLNPILKEDYRMFPKTEKELDYNEVRKYFIDEIDSYKLVFIDGIFSNWLSKTTHDECDICVLSSALDKNKYKVVIENYFNTIATKNDGLCAMNTAFCREGSYIFVPSNTIVPKPIQIMYFTTGAEIDLMLQPRNLVVVGDHSQVQIIERHQNLSENSTLTNCVSEIFVGKNTHLDYYKIQNDTLSSSLIDHTFVSQERDSVASVHTFSFGGKLTRNTLNFYQEGENCVSNLNGITLITDQQLVDNHTLVDHKYPNCESHELYKGIYDGKAKGVFNGKVMVRREAQKTNAFQQNNSVLLSDYASIDTKPQLEIFADDVKCSHGCTVGQLDNEALFYLQSRGIGKKEGQALLMYAFASNVLDTVKIPALKERINTIIALKLKVKLDFEA